MQNNYFVHAAFVTLCFSLVSCSNDRQTAQTSEAAAPSIPAAKQPTLERSCADLDGFKTEVDLVKTKDVNALNVTFIETQPSKDVIDTILRACLSATAKLDNTKDILGTAWFRKNANDDPDLDESIDTYDDLQYLSYQAGSKTIELREMDFNEK